VLKVDKEKCNGDGVCAVTCPVGAACLNDEKQKADIDNDICIECYSCMSICPQGAIYESDD
jgi:Fe-S-cluster-containing hydrogenase component 2